MMGMVTAFALLLVAHGLIHLVGVAKAFGLAKLPPLTQPIRPGARGAVVRDCGPLHRLGRVAAGVAARMVDHRDRRGSRFHDRYRAVLG